MNKFVFQGSGAWYEHLLPYRPNRHGDIVVFNQVEAIGERALLWRGGGRNLAS